MKMFELRSGYYVNLEQLISMQVYPTGGPYSAGVTLSNDKGIQITEEELKRLRQAVFTSE
jgi:hypothetical protein